MRRTVNRACSKFSESRREELKKRSLLRVNEHFSTTSNAESGDFEQALSKHQGVFINSNSGSAMVAALVAVLLGGLMVVGANLMISRYAAGLRHVEILEEIEELKFFSKYKVDCVRTINTNRTTCNANSATNIAVFAADGSVIAAANTTGSAVANSLYNIKATCGKDAAGYFLAFKARRWKDQNRTVLARDPIRAAKTYNWFDLRPLVRCAEEQDDYVIGYPYYFPNFYSLTFTNGAINYSGQDPRMHRSEGTLTRMCNLLGYRGYRGIMPPNHNASSPGDNRSLFSTTALPTSGSAFYSDTLIRVYQTSVSNNYIGPEAMVCTRSLFSVLPASGLTTTEAGGTTTFTVNLTSPPSANVVITVSSSNTGEGTVTPSSLTFTSTNWMNPQTVTVTGVNDAVQDGNRAYAIVLGAATSTDPDYSGFNPKDVSLINTDDD